MDARLAKPNFVDGFYNDGEPGCGIQSKESRCLIYKMRNWRKPPLGFGTPTDFSSPPAQVRDCTRNRREQKTALLNPDEDLVSALLLAGERGKPISETLVVASIRQFLSAAQAAPGAVLGSIAVHLARDQALQSQLRADPELMPRAIEEFLRMYAPYRVFARTAKHDVEIRGRTIKAGEAIPAPSELLAYRGGKRMWAGGTPAL